jgi:hypothetical protein
MFPYTLLAAHYGSLVIGGNRKVIPLLIGTLWDVKDDELDVDEVAREYVAAGHLRKHGLLRGGVFTLTNSGISKAEAIIKDIYPRLD